jgi:hypothetical protein
MKGTPKEIALSEPLRRHYYLRGYESALRMDENVGVVAYMKDQIDRLLADHSFIENPDAVLLAWDSGFRSGISERISRWYGAQDAARQVTVPGAVCADSTYPRHPIRRILGTLHAVRRKS